MRNRLLIAGLTVLSTLCLGCEATPGVITANGMYSLWHVLFFGLLVLLSMLVCRQSKPPSLYPRVLLGILVLHPAWWQGTSSGDCGGGKAGNAFALSGLGILLLLMQLLHLSPPKVRWTLVTALSFAVLAPIVVLGIQPDPVQPAAEVNLLDAAAAGDLPKVKLLVSQGVPVDARRRSEPVTRWEPLENVWTKLKWPDYPFQHGYTPLMLACIGGNRSTVAFLLENGADINATESDRGNSALDLAWVYSHKNIISLLLQHGATH